MAGGRRGVWAVKSKVKTRYTKGNYGRKASVHWSISAWILARRRTLNWICIASLVLGGIAGGVTWALRVDLPGQTWSVIERTVLSGMKQAGLTIEEVVIVGRDQTNSKDIADVLGVRRGAPVLGVDIHSARQRIEALGWVQSATVTRRLPGKLYIHVKERRPFAIWQKKGRLLLIDREGAVITAKDLDRFISLPVVVGRHAPTHAGALFDALARQPKLLTRVIAALRIENRRWDIRFDNGIVVRLPEEEVVDSWHRLAKLEAQYNILARDLTVIDLRLADRLIMRLKAEAAERRSQLGKKT